MSEYKTNTNDNNIYGLFSVCDGIWDEKTQKFKQNTLSEQLQCCLDGCEPVQNYCKKKCKKEFKQIFSEEIKAGKLSEEDAKSKCDLICDINHSVCADTCRLVSPIFQINPWIKCL